MATLPNPNATSNAPAFDQPRARAAVGFPAGLPAGGTDGLPAGLPAGISAGHTPGLTVETRFRFAQPAIAALLLLSALFFALHFVHLTADFPNFSRWMDWSKYTDEGWYGDAAIRHDQTGSWYVPGDFNPAAALPVWPILEAALFHFTGVTLAAARALTGVIFGLTLIASWFLLRRSHPASAGSQIPALSASAAILLLATNPFVYVFTRLAILEPLLILLMVCALLAAQAARAPRRSALPVILALGLLLPALILTKTTGLFLLPAIAWMLFATLDCNWRATLRVGAPAALLAAAIWLAYFFGIVRPHYLLDYRYLFSANAYTGMTAGNAAAATWFALHGIGWMGRILTLTAGAAILLALGNLRRLRAQPLIGALILWAAGYLAFLAYHNNLQPRYYLVVAVPLTLLIPLAFTELLLPRLASPHASPHAFRIALIAAAALLVAITLPDAAATLHIVRHPQYTLLTAARRVQAFIAADQQRDPRHNPLLLSISGSDISLMTGLRSICDDFGTAQLEDRVQRYKPGWYAAWNLIEDDKMDALTPLFHVERVATFPAMDDQDRNVLILYRLDQGENNPDGTPHRRHSTGRRFHTKVGQQPSNNQLKH